MLPLHTFGAIICNHCILSPHSLPVGQALLNCWCHATTFSYCQKSKAVVAFNYPEVPSMSGVYALDCAHALIGARALARLRARAHWMYGEREK
eukprot:4863427-Pleurochrysis_carterae.AAC.1